MTPPSITPEQQVFTTAEAGVYLRCSESHIRRLHYRGELEGTRLGGRLVFTRSQLGDCLARNATRRAS